ncbi:EI24 domain-containing protein [Comamonas sp.]
MQMIFDALWRALADCLRGKVIAWSLFPLLVVALLATVVGVFWWDGAVLSLQSWLERASWWQWLWSWMGTGSATASAVAAAVLLILAISPVLIMLALAVVATVMTPQMVELVAQRRFPLLARKRGGGWISSAAWALGSTAMALLALLLSVPLWLVPPLILVLPPLIWGWLTYRVMTFDALAEHASKAERQTIFETHRYRLILMGVICGYVGAAPSIVWASGLVFAAAFWILIPIAVWIYALVLAFSSLWFAHYALAALYSLRAAAGDAAAMLAPNANDNGAGKE